MERMGIFPFDVIHIGGGFYLSRVVLADALIRAGLLTPDGKVPQ